MNTKEWLLLEQMAGRRQIRLDMAGDLERSRFQQPKDPPLSGDAGWFDDEIKDRKSKRARNMPSGAARRNVLIGVGTGAATLGLMGLASYMDYRAGMKDLDLYERRSKAEYPDRSDMASGFDAAMVGLSAGSILWLGLELYSEKKLKNEEDRIIEGEIVRVEANNRRNMAAGEYSDVTPEEFAAMNDEQIRLHDDWLTSPERDSYQGFKDEYDEDLRRWQDARAGSSFNPMNLINRKRRPDSNELIQRARSFEGEFLGLDLNEMNEHRNLSMLSAEGRLGHRDPDLVRQTLESYGRSPEEIEYHLRYLDEVINEDRPAIWKYQESAFPRGLDLTQEVTGDYRTDMQGESSYSQGQWDDLDARLAILDPVERVGYWEREVENIVQRRNPDMEQLELAENELLDAKVAMDLQYEQMERTDMQPDSNTAETLGLAGGNPMEDIQNRERKHLRADMDGNQEFAGVAQAVATGLLAMAADAEEAGELSEEDMIDISDLLDRILEVSMVVESGNDPGEAGEVVSGFLESNMEIADMAGELGAAMLAAEGR